MAVMNRKPAIVDLILSRSTAALNKCDSWDGSDNQCVSFASNRFPHWGMRKLTALHYACLLGDMEIVEVLLRHGAQWTISDSIGLFAERYIDVSNGDGKKHEFTRLCVEETLKQLEMREQEYELKRAKEVEEKLKQSKMSEQEDELRWAEEPEEESKQSEMSEQEDELGWAKEPEEESKQSEMSEQEDEWGWAKEELKQSEMSEQEDELRQTKELEELNRRMRQSKCFSPHHLLHSHFLFQSRRRDRECHGRKDNRTEGSDSVCRFCHPFAREWLGGSRPSPCHALPWQLRYRENGTREAGCVFPQR